MQIRGPVENVEAQPDFDSFGDLSSVGSGTADHAGIDRWSDRVVVIYLLGYDG
jgi:hypothetical protein